MRIFVTGATGWIGSAVTDELLSHGHQVVGLARSDRAVGALEAKGAGVHRGSLDDPDSVAAGAADSDGVVHLAFNHDFTDYAGAGRTEHAAVQALVDILKGSDRPLLVASGLASGSTGRPLTEDDESPFRGADSMRGGSENQALDAAENGVRSVALRFSPTVHGHGDHGFVARLVQVAQEHGTASYVGDGSTRWAAVHRSDAASMVRLALEKAPAGSRVHAVAEPGIPSRDIATAIGATLGLPVTSVAPEESDAHFGWIGRFFGMDVTATSLRTQQLLGWTPSGPTLLEDLASGAYSPVAS